jgi:hypothetical protein
MRLEVLFLGLLFSLICIASGIDTVEDAPQIGDVIPVSGQINASESQSQISMIETNVSSVVFSLSWQNADSDLDMSLITPSGDQINQSAQMPIIYKKENIYAYYIVPDPMPGNWTAIIEAKKVPSEGENYDFFAAQMTGMETMAEDLAGSEDSLNSTSQINST